MNRHEALQLINKLLDPEAAIDEKQRAAAQLSELIRILILTIVSISGIVLLCLAFFKASHSFLAKAFWIILMFLLLGLLLLF